MRRVDLLRVVAYIEVFGLDLYGTKHISLDGGKGSLESYFVKQRGWTNARLERVVRALRKENVLVDVKVDRPRFYKLTSRSITKALLRCMENID